MKASSGQSAGRMAAMAGAFAGTSVLFTSAILGQQSTLDLALRIALYCFMGALPTAILALVMAYNRLDSAWFSWPFWLAAVGTGGGVLATLLHVDVKAAIIFGVAVVMSVLYYIAFLTLADP